VAALDTLKYNGQNIENKATAAIDEAIKNTTQSVNTTQPIDKVIDVFLILKKLIVVNIDNPGDKNIYRLGSPFGFYLFHDFSGLVYYFFGNFTAFRTEVAIWRLTMINDLLNERKGSMAKRVELGILEPEKRQSAEAFFSNIKLLVIVTRDEDKAVIQSAMDRIKFGYPLELYSIADMNAEIEELERHIS
jgi:hypothetical protein